MGVTLKVTTPRWIRSTLPRLQTLFHQRANEDGKFPTLTPKQEDRVRKTTPSAPDNRQASILVPIVSVNSTPSVLFTKRSPNVTSHASEISFPGGHCEENETLVEAALRETQEEIGGDWSSTVILGECTKVPSIRGTPVTPVLGVFPTELGTNLLHVLQPNPQEVEQVFCVSISELLQVETSKPLGRISGPAPVFPTHHGEIWGLTAFVLRPILHQLLKPVFVTGSFDGGKSGSKL